MKRTDGPGVVRCTNQLPNRPPGWVCNRQIVFDFAGYLRAKCPRCNAQIKAMRTGRTEIPDVDGVIVVTVTKEPNPT